MKHRDEWQLMLGKSNTLTRKRRRGYSDNTGTTTDDSSEHESLFGRTILNGRSQKISRRSGDSSRRPSSPGADSPRDGITSIQLDDDIAIAISDIVELRTSKTRTPRRGNTRRRGKGDEAVAKKTQMKVVKMRGVKKSEEHKIQMKQKKQKDNKEDGNRLQKISTANRSLQGWRSICCSRCVLI